MDDNQRDDSHEAYAHELMQERYQIACDALNRCAAAGAKPEDVKTLARECGIDPKHLTIGERNASH